MDFLLGFDAQFQSKLEHCLKQVRDEQERGVVVYPDNSQMFAAFDAVDPAKVKVWLQGQDPYPGTFNTADGQKKPFAMGLSFSVPPEARLPPTLQNIFKELESDLGVARPSNGDLSHWASQGVLLANAQLSVRAGEPNSHKSFGWDLVMQSICKALSASRPMAFILWGNNAQALEEWILNPKNHCIIKSSHPSNMGGSSKRFFGTKPFSQVNRFLQEAGRQPISWSSIAS